MLELIHADICGTISPPTPAGNRYFFLLVDDFGRVMWVYMLKSKDEALGMFQKFHVLVENETGLNHHFTKPYSPQQNGVVERQNRSVIEMARSMMKSMQVPDTLWGEAVRQAVYIQNRVPTKTLGDTTPYERWSGKKPNLEHLRVFGCIAYLKVLRGHQQKLDSKSEMLVHLGTETGSKAYRLLDPVSESPRSTFTIDGYNQEDTNLEDENDLTGEPVGSFEGINDEEFQPTPQTHVHGDEGLLTPTQSPVTSVGSTSPTSSSTTSGGAPKRSFKWVYKLKRDPSGNRLKHKARLVAKGYVQKPRVDFDDVFALVHHLEVKSAFLHGRKEEEVYVTQPEGYAKANHPAKVYKLSKTLYGLRQAPRAWNSRLDKCLKGLNFMRCRLEYALYTRKQHGNILIVGVYVDDLIVTRNCDSDVKYFKQQMNKEFEMSDMGLLSCYLGIEVTQHEDAITLKQSAYARSVLLTTGMADCNPSQSLMEHKLELTKDEGGVSVNPTLFCSIIEGLRCLAYTRLDIAYAIEIVRRFMEKPTVNHMQSVKRILRYIKGTIDYGLVYTKYHKGDVITGYSDSNHARDVEDRRSTGGMVFYLKENLVTWGSKKQQCVALSSCEAEFMAATTATCQGIWVSRLVHEITGEKAGPFVLYLD
ncbi:zinc finger, CCHC-type containing protein, partial [Tanacetum coccineum]